MKTIKESEKLTIHECRKVLEKNGNKGKYSDAEILLMRNWLYAYTEMTLGFLESKNQDELNELKNNFKATKS